jgi:histidinol-phosphate aminotransferase
MGAWRIRQAVRDIPPYVPGTSIEERAREMGLASLTRLGSNENPLGPSPRAVDAITRHLLEIHRYPDDSSTALKQALARHLGVQADNILLGTGADDVLLLLGHLFLDPGDECLYAFPSFPVYRKSALAMAAVPVESPLRGYRIDVDDLLSRVTPRTRLVFLCNPNNPTGHLVPAGEMLSFLERLPDHVFPVIDEAYAEFVTDTEHVDGVRLLREGHPLAAVRTFSKISGIAGLRVGYAVVPPELCIAANGIRNSYNINRLAQVAAEAALDDREYIERTRAVTIAGREQLARGMRELGLAPLPSQTNFVCVEVDRSADEVSQNVFRRGIVIRSLSGFGMPRHIRVTVGSSEQNDLVLAALAAALGRQR